MSVEKAKSIVETITPQHLPNMNYVDPGEVRPRRARPRVNVEARERARLERQRYAEEHRVDFPNLEGAVLVPRDSVAYVYQVPGLGQCLQLEQKPEWFSKPK